jgi:hypothetical protein
MIPSDTPFEEDQALLLYAIESAIHHTANADPEIVDWDVDEALEALVVRFGADVTGREPRPRRLSERAERVYLAVEAVCDDRRGLPVEGSTDAGVESPALFVAAFKRLRKSIKLWRAEGGRRGYLNYIAQFLNS